MDVRRAFVSAALMILAASSAAPALAQSVEDVYPVEPKDGETIGPRSALRIGVRGTDVAAMKFRVELSRDGFATVALTFDESADRNGWGLWAQADGNEQTVVYQVQRPIPDGRYEWRAWAWNGLEWILGKKRFGVRVDAVPPAEVTGIRMTADKDTKKVVLDWDSVTTDLDGRAERVARYRIYRYARGTAFPSARPYEIGTTTVPHFEESGDAAIETPILYYRVAAEDEAGNEAGRSY
jgi:hypothetical protein